MRPPDLRDEKRGPMLTADRRMLEDLRAGMRDLESALVALAEGAPAAEARQLRRAARGAGQGRAAIERRLGLRPLRPPRVKKTRPNNPNT